VSKTTEVIVGEVTTQLISEIATLQYNKKQLRVSLIMTRSFPSPSFLMTINPSGQAWVVLWATPETDTQYPGFHLVLSGPVGAPPLQELMDLVAEISSDAARVQLPEPPGAGVAGDPTADYVPQRQEERSATQPPDSCSSQFSPVSLCDYVTKTHLFASYKLVVLAMLVRAPSGGMPLSECARRFHSFYLHLYQKNLQPERATGNPPPLLLHPERLTTGQVGEILLKEPKRAFRTRDVVVFRPDQGGYRVFISRLVWGGSGKEEFDAAYVRYTGSHQHVRSALEEASAEIRA